MAKNYIRKMMKGLSYMVLKNVREIIIILYTTIIRQALQPLRITLSYF